MWIKDLSTLPIGTRFRVYNGAWTGLILLENGEKRLLVEETGVTHPITDEDPLLYIEIEDGLVKEVVPALWPGVQIGVTSGGAPYYAKDLAKALYEGTGWRQWTEMEPILQDFMRLCHGGKLPHE